MPKMGPLGALRGSRGGCLLCNRSQNDEECRMLLAHGYGPVLHPGRFRAYFKTFLTIFIILGSGGVNIIWKIAPELLRDHFKIIGNRSVIILQSNSRSLDHFLL